MSPFRPAQESPAVPLGRHRSCGRPGARDRNRRGASEGRIGGAPRPDPRRGSSGGVPERTSGGDAPERTSRGCPRAHEEGRGPRTRSPDGQVQPERSPRRRRRCRSRPQSAHLPQVSRRLPWPCGPPALQTRGWPFGSQGDPRIAIGYQFVCPLLIIGKRVTAPKFLTQILDVSELIPELRIVRFRSIFPAVSRGPPRHRIS